jgi:acetyltransferase-like isoleucine patch superfamily enzyme
VSELVAGADLHADGTAIIGYPSTRVANGNVTLGAGAHVRSGTAIYVGSHIGDRFQTGHNVVVREECVIGDDVSVWSNTVIDSGCYIGNRVEIHSNCYIAKYTDIEDDAFLAPGVCIGNDLYAGQTASAQLISAPSIGRGAQIGVNVTILPFVRIGAGCLIGAGAVVVLDIPQGCVAFGNPAIVRGRVGDLKAIEERAEMVSNSVSRYCSTGSVPLTRNGRRDDRD